MRLTEKIDNYGYVVLYDHKEIAYSTQKIEDKGSAGYIAGISINKLGQLEDIEEELGIDLITFFKIYNTDHFYIKGKEYPWKIRHYQKHGIMVGTNKPRYLPFKEYGKSWALTKEELE